MLSYLIFLLALLSCFASASIALSLLVNTGKRPVILAASAMAIGAYSTSVLLGGQSLHLLILMAVLYIFFICMIFWMYFRMDEDVIILCTLLMSLIFSGLLVNLSDITNGVKGLYIGIDTFDERIVCFISISILVVCCWLHKFFNSGPISLELKAVVNNRNFAEIIGINPYKASFILTFSAITILAIVGANYAIVIGYIHPLSFSDSLSLGLLAAVLLAANGRVWPVIVCSIVIFGIPEAVSFLEVPSSVLGHIRNLIFGVILISIVLLRGWLERDMEYDDAS